MALFCLNDGAVERNLKQQQINPRRNESIEIIENAKCVI